MRILATAVVLTALVLPHKFLSQADETVGVVYEDVNRNQIFDEADRLLEDVLVSSLSEIRSTNSEGAATVPVEARDIVFVIKPTGYALPLQNNRVPDFYYLHYPNGTSADLKYPGVFPTGPLPDTLFFPMQASDHGETITANVVGDPQIPREKENQIFRLETVPELMETDADFGLFLGDIADDDLDIFGSCPETVQGGSTSGPLRSPVLTDGSLPVWIFLSSILSTTIGVVSGSDSISIPKACGVRAAEPVGERPTASAEPSGADSKSGAVRNVLKPTRSTAERSSRGVISRLRRSSCCCEEPVRARAPRRWPGNWI